MPPGFTAIDNDAVLDRLPAIGLAAYAVYSVLRRHCDTDGACWPSVQTIASKAGVTARTVRTAIARLVSLGLLVREPRQDTRGMKTSNHYRVLPIPRDRSEANDSTIGKKRPYRSEANDSADRKQTTDEQEPREQEPFNKTHSSCRALRFDAADRVTAGWMFGLIQKADPKAKAPNIDRWANELRLMREQDKRTDDEIRSVFRWANADSFWRANILSPAKLREKFSQLSLKMKTGSHRKPDYAAGPGQRFDPSAPELPVKGAL